MTALRSFVDESGIFAGRRITCIVECSFRIVNQGIDEMKEPNSKREASARGDSHNQPDTAPAI
jgi:hypothetical protein